MVNSRHVSINVSRQRQTSGGWDLAIVEAEQEIQDLNRKKKRLEQALRIFRLNKKEGVKCPEALRKRGSCAGR